MAAIIHINGNLSKKWENETAGNHFHSQFICSCYISDIIHSTPVITLT